MNASLKSFLISERSFTMPRKISKSKSTDTQKEEKIKATTEAIAEPVKKRGRKPKTATTAKAEPKETVTTESKSAEKEAKKNASSKTKTSEKKTAASKTKKSKSETKAKTTKKTETSNMTHFFEIDGEQISTADIEERIREAYKADGHRIGNMKDVFVYYNFAERRAYYVVNGKAEDRFIEF